MFKKIKITYQNAEEIYGRIKRITTKHKLWNPKRITYEVPLKEIYCLTNNTSRRDILDLKNSSISKSSRKTPLFFKSCVSHRHKNNRLKPKFKYKSTSNAYIISDLFGTRAFRELSEGIETNMKFSVFDEVSVYMPYTESTVDEFLNIRGKDITLPIFCLEYDGDNVIPFSTGDYVEFYPWGFRHTHSLVSQGFWLNNRIIYSNDDVDDISDLQHYHDIFTSTYIIDPRAIDYEKEKDINDTKAKEVIMLGLEDDFEYFEAEEIEEDINYEY